MRKIDCQKNTNEPSLDAITEKMNKVVKDNSINVDELVAEAVEWARKSKDKRISNGSGNSVVELRKATEKLTVEQIEKEIELGKKKP